MNNEEMKIDFDRSIEEAAVEILGQQEFENIFDHLPVEEMGAASSKIPPNFLSHISNEFSIKYHRNTARGLLLRIGDASFPKLRRRFSDLNALGSIDNRLKPLERRFESSLQDLVRILSHLLGMDISVQSLGEQCFGVNLGNTSQPLSMEMQLFYIAGVLRAFGVWLDSRREYRVQVNTEADSNRPASIDFCILPAA